MQDNINDACLIMFVFYYD